MTALDRRTLLPAVASAVADEWAALRGEDGMAVDPFAWEADSRVGGEELPADSLALVRLATRIGQMFHLEEAGAGDNLLRFRTLGDWAEMAATAVAEVGKITFLTSGTTGDPQPRTHDLAWLEQEAAFLADHLGRAAPGRQRVHTWAPPHHIYGFLFGILLPRHLAVPVRQAGHPSHWAPGQLAAGDLAVGFPLVWQHMAERLPAFPENIHGTTSTAPCPPELHRRLRGQGLAGLTEIFGSSETGGVGVREDPDSPFALMPHWRPGETGTLIRRGPDGAETPVAFDTDHVEWPSPRYFWPLGRADDVVQVGGHNVSPSRVARHLEDDSRVAEAQVGLDGNSQRLTARVLPSAEGQALDPRDLRAALESRAADLRPAERPVRYRIASGDTERSREAG